jgi:hypothetical protein
MIFKCQRKNHPNHPGYFHIHTVDARDHAHAREKMKNLSLDGAWADPEHTDVWCETDEWDLSTLEVTK